MKIICIGRNYSEHARELKNEIPVEPVIFMKPDSSVLQKHNPFVIPLFSNVIHYEVELILKINRLGKHIEEKFAHRYFSEIGLGIDFTARDLQEECKEKGLPWEKAKAFDGSCVVGKFFKISAFESTNIHFELQKNGKTVQKGNSTDMTFNFPSIISHVSKYFTLKIGDMIFTGTPAGVGPVSHGDILEGFLEGNKVFRIKVK